jgi:DsbC/DsbD-like thiol-disulfide interchange protein/cytochrome c biogenesis protein CcdA
MRTRWILLAVAALAPLAAHAQVQASLVSADASVQPGHPVNVALRLVHEPHWHSYWLNAGTGYPTRLTWNLPAGWRAGAIQWPTPILIKDSQGNVTGHGYDGVLYLPVTLVAPADARPGGSVTLRAAVNWLMCADICIPGKADVSLMLPVSADPPQPNAQVRAEIAKMPMPHDASGWQVAASKGANVVTLEVRGPQAISGAHFYSEKEFIQYDQPQAVAGKSSQWALTLPLADGEPVPGRLIGVLAYTDASGAYRGLNVDVPLSAGAATAAVAGTSKAGGLPSSLSAGVLVLAFFGGLILNLMPCVFPVLGIKVVGFINQAGSDRRKVTLHGLMFTAGVLLSFWALAGALAALRAGGEQLGWGFQLQSAPFVFALAVVMLVFALSLSGVFEFGLRATAVGGDLQMKDGYGGSFFAGVLATVVATPCSAPFLAPALGAALALPTGESFLVFTVIALGLSAPYLLLSAFPQAVNVLPRPGRWMETFKQVMAFPLYATVGYLVWVLAAQTSENGLLAVLFGLTVVAMAVWLYGRYTAPGSSNGRVRFAFVGGLALLIIGLYLGWPRAAQATDITWEPWSPERVEQLRGESRAIYVDFTARWCATCQANKKLVFGSDKVKSYFRERNVALLKADWTNSDPRITAELARWNRSAVPFNLVYLPRAAEKNPSPRPAPRARATRHLLCRRCHAGERCRVLLREVPRRDRRIPPRRQRARCIDQARSFRAGGHLPGHLPRRFAQ